MGYSHRYHNVDSELRLHRLGYVNHHHLMASTTLQRLHQIAERGASLASEVETAARNAIDNKHDTEGGDWCEPDGDSAYVMHREQWL